MHGTTIFIWNHPNAGQSQFASDQQRLLRGRVTHTLTDIYVSLLVMEGDFAIVKDYEKCIYTRNTVHYR